MLAEVGIRVLVRCATPFEEGAAVNQKLYFAVSIILRGLP